MTLRIYTIGIVLLFGLVFAPSLSAQEGTALPDSLQPKGQTDTLGSALLYEFKQDYDVVFKGVKEALTELGYEVTYSSKKRNLIETSFKQLADADNFYDVMNLYGEIPYMRSPGWSIGRVKVTVSFEPVDSVRTAIKVLAQLSGFEEQFTNMWHYWASNGRIEQEVMSSIITRMEGKS